MNREKTPGMSVIVKTISSVTAWFILLFGSYVFLHGPGLPGSGFVGGMIVALALVQLMLAYGKEAALRKVPHLVTVCFERQGAVLFLSWILLGFTIGYFFLNFFGQGEPFRILGAGTVSLVNVAVGLKAGAGILGIYVAFVLIRVEKERRKNSTMNSGQ